jgi:hypothetical protein
MQQISATPCMILMVSGYQQYSPQSFQSSSASLNHTNRINQMPHPRYSETSTVYSATTHFKSVDVCSHWHSFNVQSQIFPHYLKVSYFEKVISFLWVTYLRCFIRVLVESLGFAIGLAGVQACSYWWLGGWVFFGGACCLGSWREGAVLGSPWTFVASWHSCQDGFHFIVNKCSCY